jgi:hypothetical protein
MLVPFPRLNDLTEKNRLHPAHWVPWFQNLFDTVNAQPERLQQVTLTEQSASIATTAIPLQKFPQGLYRVTWYVRITRAATISSDLTIRIRFLDGTVALFTEAALGAANTVTTWHSGTVVIQSDLDGPISYETVYSSAGATSMQYSIRVTLERLP